jgi:hypothetical protein
MEETRVPGENHWPAASHWQFLSHNVVSSTPHHEQCSTIHTSSHLPLASKETFFTYVTSQINKDSNLYYEIPICIYLYKINNALNETEDT